MQAKAISLAMFVLGTVGLAVAAPADPSGFRVYWTFLDVPCDPAIHDQAFGWNWVAPNPPFCEGEPECPPNGWNFFNTRCYPCAVWWRQELAFSGMRFCPERYDAVEGKPEIICEATDWGSIDLRTYMDVVPHRLYRAYATTLADVDQERLESLPSPQAADLCYGSYYRCDSTGCELVEPPTP